MTQYINAENLKCKRTFVKKLNLLAPLFMLFLAYISGKYLVQDGYNWWYTIIFPGYITLITALTSQNEENKLNCRAIFALPVSLKKTWISKCYLLTIYVAVASLIHMVGIILGEFLINPACEIKVYQLMVGTGILVITSLWQIPFCLFLSKKFGFLTAILLNVLGGIALNFITVDKSYWWACPYSYGTRLMCPVLGILPNGLLAPKGDSLLNASVIPVAITMSILLFALLLAGTSNWFSKQEVQ